MKNLTQEEMLEILCAPEPVDEPEESDLLPMTPEDEAAEEMFVRSWIVKELN